MAHGTGYNGGRQPEMGGAPGVGKSNRNGSSVGVAASIGTSGLAPVKPATTGVGLEFPIIVQAVRARKEIIVTNLKREMSLRGGRWSSVGVFPMYRDQDR